MKYVGAIIGFWCSELLKSRGKNEERFFFKFMIGRGKEKSKGDGQRELNSELYMGKMVYISTEIRFDS